MKNLIRKILRESIEYLLDKESEEHSFISDDYGMKDTSQIKKDIIEQVRESLDKFKSLVPIWNDIRIAFVENVHGDFLGRFRSGTSSSVPVILLSPDDLVDASEEYNVPLWVAVETTLFHELGHAICELERDVYGYEYLEYGDEEEWVEDFAYELHEWNDIPDDLKNFIKVYKSEV